MLSAFFIFVRGILMGIADSVPGVSGGTVAMIVGIYERLVTAISHFDTKFLSLLSARKVRQAASHTDFGFLATLLLGIIVGLGGSSIFMHTLLTDYRSVTFGAFMGMILASVIILYRQIKNKNFACGAAMVIGAFLAWYVTTMNPLTGRDDDLLYVFGCGLTAICAMILPGISGSYILLILGEYEPIIARVKDLASFQTTPQDLLTLCVFGSGCVIGLLAFSHLLKYLLRVHHSVTISTLTGFMAGSITCLWPFQKEIENVFQNVSFMEFPIQTRIYALCAFLAGLVGVLALEKAASLLVPQKTKK
ncbi:MAG: DUF368 domain-containing protein [Planctomycetia bacterium]|nr:DUF368 domain-containing protein [Planctomycetia bacterium]